VEAQKKHFSVLVFFPWNCLCRIPSNGRILSRRGLDVGVTGDAVRNRASPLINRPRLELEPPGHIYSANVIVPVTL